MATMKMPMAVGTGSGSGAPELVWVHPSAPNPTGTFAAQTINESSTGWVSGKHIDDYDGFIVAVVYNNISPSTRGRNLGYIVKDATTLPDPFSSKYTYSVGTPNTSQKSASATVYGRYMEVTANGIEIASQLDVGNDYDVPVYIWGVRGELTV